MRAQIRLGPCTLSYIFPEKALLAECEDITSAPGTIKPQKWGNGGNDVMGCFGAKFMFF